MMPVPYDHINTQTSPCPYTHLAARWGIPQGLNQQCQNSKQTNPYVIPIKVHDKWKAMRMYAPFGAILSHAFARLHKDRPDIYSGLVTAGAECVRYVRGSTTTPSSHCWASAIDMGYKTIDPYGDGFTQAELLVVYSYLKQYGLFWGAGFGEKRRNREDAMHFEVSKELLPLLPNKAIKPVANKPYHELWEWVTINGFLVPK